MELCSDKGGHELALIMGAVYGGRDCAGGDKDSRGIYGDGGAD